MRPVIRPALAALCLCALLSFAAPWRAPQLAHAAQGAKPQIAFTSINSHVALQQAGAKTTPESKAPAVREIDLAGLKKLLERDGARARPLLVNFWATWCEPCRAEFPDLVKIDAEYRKRGLDFVVISIDDVSEINTSVPKFLREMRAEMPAYLLNTPDTDVAIKAVDPAWSGGLPATFLYDASGKLVFKHLGRIKPEELRADLDKVTGKR